MIMNRLCISYAAYDLSKIGDEDYRIQNGMSGMIGGLNSGIRNRYNFFQWGILFIRKNRTDSGDIKSLVQFSGSQILKILLNFWNCVGGTHMRGYSILKITELLNLVMLVILIYKMRGTPTQMLKSWFSVFSSQEIGSRLISFEMNFKSLQLELIRFLFHSLSLKILKILEFNPMIGDVCRQWRILMFTVPLSYPLHIFYTSGP